MADSTEPVYSQIAQVIRAQILDEEYLPGDRIPSENEMCQLYSATRGTIRRALQLLVDEGYLRSERGKGTFVNYPEDQMMFWSFGGLTDRVKQTGEVALAQVLDARTIYRDNRPTFRLRRLRSLNMAGKARPISVDISYLPLDLFPDIDTIDFTDRSLYETLRTEYERYPATSIVSLVPRMVDQSTRDALQEPAAQKSLLHASGQTFDANGARLEETEITYSSRIRAVMKIDHIHGYAAPLISKGAINGD